MSDWMTICILNTLSTLLLTAAIFYFLPIPPALSGWLLCIAGIFSLLRQVQTTHLTVPQNLNVASTLFALLFVSVIGFHLPLGNVFIVLLAAAIIYVFSVATLSAQLIKTSSIVLLVAVVHFKPQPIAQLLSMTFLGAVCGIFSFKPLFLQRYLRSDALIYQRNGFKALAEFTQVFFAGLEASYYPLHVYSVERALHFKKMQCLKAIEAWQVIAEQSHTDEACARLKESFTLLIDASQLRFRISDFTVFGLCADEIRQLGKTLVSGLGELERARVSEQQRQSLQRALAE